MDVLQMNHNSIHHQPGIRFYKSLKLMHPDEDNEKKPDTVPGIITVLQF
jgi:hypothetical protein